MTLTKEQRTAAIKWLADLPPHILREKIERGHDYGSGKTFSDKGKIMEVLQQTACIAEMLADRLVAAPSALSGDAGEGELARFGHHPDPAFDFCHEVECCENDAYDLRGEGGVHMRGALLLRIERAMTFRVGGDQGCVAAKQSLRDLETAMKEGREREYIDVVIAARVAK